MRAGQLDDMDKVKSFELKICKYSLQHPAFLVAELADALAQKLMDEFIRNQNARDRVFFILEIFDLIAYCHYKNFFGGRKMKPYYEGLSVLINKIKTWSKHALNDINCDDDLEEGQLNEIQTAMTAFELMKAMKEVAKDDTEMNQKFEVFDNNIESLREYAEADSERRIAAFKREYEMVPQRQQMQLRSAQNKSREERRASRYANSEIRRLEKENKRLRSERDEARKSNKRLKINNRKRPREEGPESERSRKRARLEDGRWLEQ